MHITLVEPFFAGSHKAWAKGFQEHSPHQVELLTLKGRHWKWRMYGGAVTLAQQFISKNIKTDLILASNMLDLTTFLALTRHHTKDIPTAVYFHENQLTYPWSPTDADVKLQRNVQYSFLNYTTALVADKVYFNSEYHRQSFLNELPLFLKAFPDYKELQNVDLIAAKSKVLHLGMNLKQFDNHQTNEKSTEAIIVWNHRWEYDKNPEVFFKTLARLDQENIAFKLVVLGESYKKKPAIFKWAKEHLSHRIVHFGYVDSFQEYAQWLWKADIAPTTSNQDFFGGSVVEAMYCNCFPLLPNRLAYPEHIPIEQRFTFLYDSDEELYQKLKAAILNIDEIRKNTNTQDFVKQYDWQKMIEQYSF